MKKKNGNGSSQLVTKKYLDERFVASEAKMDFKLEKLERKIDEKAQQYCDQILTSNDKLAKTLESILLSLRSRRISGEAIPYEISTATS